jgi:hypothetical protein
MIFFQLASGDPKGEKWKGEKWMSNPEITRSFARDLLKFCPASTVFQGNGRRETGAAHLLREGSRIRDC